MPQDAPPNGGAQNQIPQGSWSAGMQAKLYPLQQLILAAGSANCRWLRWSAVPFRLPVNWRRSGAMPSDTNGRELAQMQSVLRRRYGSPFPPGGRPPPDPVLAESAMTAIAGSFTSTVKCCGLQQMPRDRGPEGLLPDAIRQPLFMRAEERLGDALAAIWHRAIYGSDVAP
jgi:hypothetical protein